MQNKQVKYGVIISYLLVVLNATYGLFLTPYIIGQIGENSFGVYKTVSSFTSALMVLDLGLGGTMMRYIAKYRTDGEENKIPNFVFMGGVQTFVVCVGISVLVAVLYFFLDVIYGSGLTADELISAKQLYVFLGVGIICHIIENFLNGIISGYNRFIFSNGIKVVRLIVRIVAVVIFLWFFKTAIVLVIVDLACTLFFVFIEILYIVYSLNLKVYFTHWEAYLFFDSLKYTLLLFISSLVDQINGNVAIVAIGAVIGSAAVTIYSLAALIFGVYQQLSTAVSSVVLPTVTESLKNDDDRCTNTTSFVVKAGRVQFLLLGAVLAGFFVLGKQFIGLWLGEGYSDVYYLTLILIGPALLELCINVCLSILRAKNMLGFRTIVISVMAAINLLISLLLVKRFGYYVCALSSSLCYCIGSVVIMGIYYYKKFHINLFGLYKRIFGKIWICIVFSALAAWAMSSLFEGYALQFAGGFVAFVLVYGVTLLTLGLNKEEKKVIFSKIRRYKND